MKTDRKKLAYFFVVLTLSACGGDPEPLPPMFNLCETSADCSALTPECRVLDLAGTGNPASVCTAPCRLDFEDPLGCPKNPDVGREMFSCLGVNEQGRLDASSSETFCVRPCPPEAYELGLSCSLIGRRDAPGVCALLEYDELGPQYVCLEPGTPLPSPIIPTFSSCDTPADCSSVTPDCRQLDPWGVGHNGSWCTRVCEDDSECPANTTNQGVAQGRCLGVDAQGRIDLESSEKLCFQGCLEHFAICTLGAGHPSIQPRSGSCDAVLPDDTELTMGLVCF